MNAGVAKDDKIVNLLHQNVLWDIIAEYLEKGQSEMSLFEKRDYYKPFEYPWAFEAYHTQQKVHWLPEEVSLADDVKDWNKKLTKKEKNLLTQIFRFFTQADLDIASGYLDKYIPVFQPPEIRMMLSAFAAMEATHIHAYSLLLDTVGMPEIEYKAFAEYSEMAEKHDYFKDCPDMGGFRARYEHAKKFLITDSTLEAEIAKTLAVYSAFGEGMQLFSSFAILLNFARYNKMKGMCQIVTWSIRDESLHVESMIKLFHAFIDENKKIWKNDLKAEIYQAALDMVALEDKFIDLTFKQGGIEGLDKDEVKQYIRYIADRRLLQLGLKTKFKVKENPLPWLDWILNGVEHTNFFENRATEYSKGALTGSWKEVWENYDHVPDSMSHKQSEAKR